MLEVCSKISEKNLSKEEVKALNNLVKNKDVVIQKADKGNNGVILNKSDYISKWNKILEDTYTFKRVNVEEGKALNHLIHMQERIIRLLKSLEDQSEISEKERNDLYSSGSKPGVLYGLAKIHKALEGGTPSICPILSAKGTPTYNLAKFCNQLQWLIIKDYKINDYKINDYKIKGSFSFAKEVLDFDASCFIASFDIKSLFTNIPQTETLNLCVQNLYRNQTHVNNFTKVHFKSCLRLLCLNHFLYLMENFMNNVMA